MKTLLDEAIESLEIADILSEYDNSLIKSLFIDSIIFNFSGNGKVNWNLVEHFDLQEIEEVLNYNAIIENDLCYIIWNDKSLPIIKTTIKCIINSFDDVSAINFDTWFFLPQRKTVIEYTFGIFKINNVFTDYEKV